jgi:hypothetical protein
MTIATISNKINQTVESLFNDGAIHVKSLAAVLKNDEMGIKYNGGGRVRFSPMFSYLFDKPLLATTRGHHNSILMMGKLTVERCFPPSFFFKTNMVKPSIMANSYINLLKIIPFLHGEKGDIYRYDALHLNFVPVSTTNNSILHFQIQDNKEKNVLFKKDHEILFNLILREA